MFPGDGVGRWRGEVGENGEGLEYYLWVVLDGVEVIGAGLSTAAGGRWWNWAAAALLRRRWEGEVGPRSFGGERPSSWRVRFGEGQAETVAPRAAREGAALMAPTMVLGCSDGAGKETTSLGASAVARERGVAVDFGNVGAER